MSTYSTTITGTKTNAQKPRAPDSLPAYLADGLAKQNRETLADVRAYADALIDYHAQLEEQPITDDDIPDNAELVEDDDSDDTRGAIMREYRTCGDDYCHCMNGGEKHGPYNYRIYRDGESVKKEYLGKADE